MNHPSILYRSPEPVDFPETTVESLGQKLKKAMIAEAALIASNWKTFLGCMALFGLWIAELSSGDSPIREWTLTGALVVAIGYLVRANAQKDKKIEELYERLADDEDEQKESHPRRHHK